jgi:uncharacterized protein (DUF3820 family)
MQVEIFQKYFPVLLAGGVLEDVTEEYAAWFARCIPFPSLGEAGELVNTISVLIRDKRVPRKLWHVFGGKCFICIDRWTDNNKVDKFFYDELRHAGLAIKDGSVWSDTRYTANQVRRYMRHWYSCMPREKLEERISRLRPRFPPGKYLGFQAVPGSMIEDVLAQEGVLLASKETILEEKAGGWWT